jgi:isoleucyl-tRNA synthetase
MTMLLRAEALWLLSQTADTYRKLRFTLRFLLGNLDGFDPETDAVPYDQLPATDRSAASPADCLTPGPFELRS